MTTTSSIDQPISVNVITADGQPEETNHGAPFTSARLTTLSDILKLAAILNPVASFLSKYYQRGAFGEEGVIMPHCTFGFVISGLLGFIEIKSQGQVGFPFQTHPRVIMVSVTSLLMYACASASEQVIFGARPDGTNSVYPMIARSGRMCCLCILVGSLASLFYF